MQFTVRRAKPSEHPIIQSLACFYTYEMSRYCGWETPADGCFTCSDLSQYWTEATKHPFVIRVSDELAGFALIDKEGTSDATDWTMGEFFIVAKFQNQGLGRMAAQQLFDQFKGRWEVMQMPKNRPAIAFWEQVIDEYAQGDFGREEKLVTDPKPHQMVVLSFLSAN